MGYNGDTFDNLEHILERVRAKRRTVKVMWRTKEKVLYRIGIHTKRDVLVRTLGSGIGD